MTDSEKLIMLKTMTGEPDEGLLTTYLRLAAQKVLNRAYPYGTDLTEVPVEYELVQVEIAAYLVNKRGAEGETSHSENGIARSYEDGDVPASLMRQITPHAATLTGTHGIDRKLYQLYAVRRSDLENNEAK